MDVRRTAAAITLMLVILPASGFPGAVRPAVTVLGEIGGANTIGLDRMRTFLGPHSELDTAVLNESCRCLGYVPPESSELQPDEACLKHMDDVEAANISLAARWLHFHLRGWRTHRVRDLGTQNGRREFEIIGNRGRIVKLALDNAEGQPSRTYFDILGVNGVALQSLLEQDRASGSLCTFLRSPSVSGSPDVKRISPRRE